MSFSDSNASKPFKGVGKVFKDLKLYTTTQGQHGEFYNNTILNSVIPKLCYLFIYFTARNAFKGNELISSIKQSTDKFPSFKKNRVRMGNLKHESLCEGEDDEAFLWNDLSLDHDDTSTGKDKAYQNMNNNNNTAKPPTFQDCTFWDSLKGTEFSFISSNANQKTFSRTSTEDMNIFGQNNKLSSYNSSRFGKRIKIPFLKKV
jgi:hypothetical protein